MGFQGKGMGFPGDGMGFPGKGKGFPGDGIGFQGKGMGYPGAGMGFPGAAFSQASFAPEQNTSGRPCSSCRQWKPSTAYSKAQLKKTIGSSTCIECIGSGGPDSAGDGGAWIEPENTGTKRCYFCHKFKPNSGYSVNQRKKTLQGLGSCYECTEAGLWVVPDDVGDSAKLCGACGNWKDPETFSKSQLKNNADAPKCTECVNTGREILERFRRHDFDSRSMRPAVRPRSRSKSTASSSSGSPKKKKKQKKRRKKSSSSSRSSSSSSSVRSAKAENTASSAATSAEVSNPELDLAKKSALDQLVKMKSVEPRDARMKEFRALLRQWHPDKNPEKKDLATAVFQFLQKGKSLLG